MNHEGHYEMSTQPVSVTFEASDDDGNVHVLVAERTVTHTVIGERYDPWRYRTEDGRQITLDHYDRVYHVEPDDLRLTSTDPNQPEG